MYVDEAASVVKNIVLVDEVWLSVFVLLGEHQHSHGVELGLRIYNHIVVVKHVVILLGYNRVAHVTVEV